MHDPWDPYNENTQAGWTAHGEWMRGERERAKTRAEQNRRIAENIERQKKARSPDAQNILTSVDVPVRHARYAPRRFGRAVSGWLFLAVAAVVAGAVYGTPHVRTDAPCRIKGLPGRGAECRMYEYCTYAGIWGRRMEFPEYGGTCPGLRLLPREWKGRSRGR